MSKVDIKRLDSITKNDTTATEQINDNFKALQAAIENTVSRDGIVPNYMDADLDLNSYRIINAAAPVEGKDVVTLEYFEEKAGGAIEAAAEAKASASKAASSAQSALVASNNAIGQLAQAEGLLTATEGQLEDTKQFVNAAKSDIEDTKNTAIEMIDSTVTQAKADINTSIDEATMDISDTSTSAINTINSVKDSATSEINSAVSSAETEITSTKNTAINTINTSVSTAESNISTIVSDAEGSITTIAITEANKAIANSAQEATDTATANLNSYVDGTVKPSLQTYVDQAQSDANSAATSMEQAALSATAASNYANNASADADNASESATHAATSATDSEHYSEDSRIWAEGTDSEVTALGGVHSSKVWSETAQAVVAGKQDIANLSQTLDNSTTKYPSNAAVKAAIDAKDSLPDQTGNADKFLKTDGTTASWAEIGGGLEIGDIGFAPLGIDETQNKRRYLNGQVISQTQFVSFTDKVKAAIALYPSLSATEENWQAEVTNSKLGQCGKFVIDDTSGTIRLPKVVNINGLTDLSLMGGIKAESLPNIKGRVPVSTNGPLDPPFENLGTINANGGSGNINFIKNGYFDLSTANETYQDNAPVQQEAVQYPYFIQVATGSEESVDVSTEIQLNNPFFFGMHIWSDTAISNASWLISNGSYHSGATYADFYEWLLKIKNGTLTVGGVSVKAYGASGITDYDYVINTANTTFRLPVKVKLASGNAVVGNGMTLGLTNGTTETGFITDSQGVARCYSGAFGKDVSASYGPSTGVAAGYFGITTDPTKSGIETSSDGLKLYFYVGETVQDANVINAAGVLTRVANSIDRTVKSDRETVVGWGMPDYSAGITFGTPTITEKSYTAPTDGLIVLNLYASSDGRCYVLINSVTMFDAYSSSTIDTANTVSFYVSKGDVIKYITCINNLSPTAKFFPLKGVK